MKVPVSTLKQLLEELSRQTGNAVDYAGLKNISEMIGELGSEYLYKKILQEIKLRKDDELHGIRDFHLHRILKFLGYSSLSAFEDARRNPLSDQILSLQGNYYSYVRANYKTGLVLRSPVRIYRKESRVLFELLGKDLSYQGEVILRNGCIFILMTSAEGKSFHHVYKVGTRKHPKVLQGVFSGVSTAFDPIGGRTVLIRQEKPFEQLTNRKTATHEMIGSGEIEEARVGQYFRDYFNNNLSPFKSSDFDYGDLAQ